MSTIKSIGILIFDQVELLDFAGPLQVFTAAKYLDGGSIDRVDTISIKEEITVAKSNLVIKSNKIIDASTYYDLLIIPGGIGTRELIENKEHLNILKRIIDKSSITASVCTGSLILAKLGYLKNLSATTHFGAVDLLKKIDPSIIVDRSKRYIDHGDKIIAEGVSAGIDMSFYILNKYGSHNLSALVKKYIEYYPEK